MIGKWHLGHYQSKYLPHKRGFDEFYGYLSDQLWYYNHKSPHACDGSNCYYDMQRNGAVAEDSIGVYSTFLFVDAFTDVLENEDASNPLLCGMFPSIDRPSLDYPDTRLTHKKPVR